MKPMEDRRAARQFGSITPGTEEGSSRRCTVRRHRRQPKADLGSNHPATIAKLLAPRAGTALTTSDALKVHHLRDGPSGRVSLLHVWEIEVSGCSACRLEISSSGSCISEEATEVQILRAVPQPRCHLAMPPKASISTVLLDRDLT